MKIIPVNSRPTLHGSEQWFTGQVWLDEVVTGSAPSRFKAARVSFSPGARTHWHTHPLGQGLHVVSGLGLIQLAGQPIQTIAPGDSVWIEANELHWHGAAPGNSMVHLAIQEADAQGINVVWLNPVTDGEYQGV